MAFRSVTTNIADNTGGTSIVNTAPAGLADNDILLFIIIWNIEGQVSNPGAPTWPTGFTQIIDDDSNNGYGGGGNTEKISVAWKKAASESGSYTTTIPLQTQGWASTLMALSGRDQTTPIHITGARAQNGQVVAPDTIVAPSITTTVVCDVVLAVGGGRYGTPPSNSWSTPGIFIKRVDQALFTNLGSEEQAVYTEDSIPLGVLGTASVLQSAGAQNTRNYGVQIALAASVNISVQPASQTILLPSQSTATFTATAAGNGSLSYQWKKDGVNVGSNSSSYTTPSLDMTYNKSGYTVDVTDTIGTTTSNIAVLTVRIIPPTAWLSA